MNEVDRFARCRLACLRKRRGKAGKMTEAAKCLPPEHEGLSLTPRIQKPRMVACNYNHSTGDVETDRPLLVFTGQPDSLNLQDPGRSERPCLKSTKVATD